MSDLWVFGYGSLMWNTGFPFTEKHRAVVSGWRRGFCLYSVHYRGTGARPGMVLGLDRGGACEGMVFRVPAAGAPGVVAYLRKREQVTGVYREAVINASVKGSGEVVRALVYLAERCHPNYAGRLPVATQARLIRAGRGVGGANLDYFLSTLLHLRELGIREPELERIRVSVGALALPDRSCADRSRRAEALRRSFMARPLAGRAKRLRPDQRVRFLWRKNRDGVR